MMKNRAYTEVVELLKYIPLKDYLKIPKETISILKYEQDEDYYFEFDKTKAINEQGVSRSAWIIFLKIYMDYILNENEKSSVKEILKINTNKKNTVNNREKLFSAFNDEKKEDKQICCITEKEKWYKKIIKSIINFFKIKKD